MRRWLMAATVLLTINAFGQDGIHDGQINPDAVSARWNYDPASVSGLGITAFSRNSRPAVSEDGSMFFVYGDGDADTGVITAIDAYTGELVWSIEVPSYVAFGSVSSPTFHNGFVYWAGSKGAAPAMVMKINAQTGSTADFHGGWTSILPPVGGVLTHSIVNASPTIGGGKVFISSYGGMDPTTCCHFALDDSDGSISWSNNDGGQGQGAMAYDASSDRVFQTIYDGSDNRLRAYNAADGSTAWTSSWTFTNSPMQAGIAFDGGKLYLQDYSFAGDGTLYKVNAADGILDWSAATPASGTSLPAVDASGQVFVYGNWLGAGQTRGYDSAGNPLWTSSLGGGWAGSPGYGDGLVFVGAQDSSDLYLLNAAAGSMSATIANGGGPVVFNERSFVTTGTDGILYAYSTGDDFANEVNAYIEGAGVTKDFISKNYFNDPSCALGRPTVDTTGDNWSLPATTAVPVVFPNPPFRAFELVTVGTGGSLDLKFDHKIQNDPDNPYGVDLICFGNALQSLDGGGFWTNGDPNASTLANTTFIEDGVVAVSQDGSTWHTFASGPSPNGFAPTWGRVYDTENPYRPDGDWSWNNWWGEPTDATLAIDPDWTKADFAGKTVAQASQACGRSAGGVGYDISELGLDWIQYVRITPGASGMPDIDAVSDARTIADATAPTVVSNLSLAAGAGSFDLNWDNPADGDFAGVLIIRKSGSAPVGTPIDGIGYFPGHNKFVLDGEVVYNGSADSFSDDTILAGTPYHYAVFAYDATLNYSAAETTAPYSFTARENPLAIIEGGTGDLAIRLTEQPAGEVTLTITHSSGDAGIYLTDGDPQELVFDTGNWDVYQTVAITTTADGDVDNDSAGFAVTATDGAFMSANATVEEIEADVAWLGGVGDWSEAADWSGGEPDAADRVFVPAGSVLTVNEGALPACGQLTVEPGACLIIDRAAGFAPAGALRVDGGLRVENGVIDTGGENLVIGAEGRVESGVNGFSAGNMIVTGAGYLRKEFDAAGQFIFPVGTDDGTAEYSPIMLEFSSGTFAADAYIGVRAVAARQPDNPSAQNYLERYWSVDNSGVSSFSCAFTAEFVDSDLTGSFDGQRVMKWNGAAWSLPSSQRIDSFRNSIYGVVDSFSDITTPARGFCGRAE